LTWQLASGDDDPVVVATVDTAGGAIDPDATDTNAAAEVADEEVVTSAGAARSTPVSFADALAGGLAFAECEVVAGLEEEVVARLDIDVGLELGVVTGPVGTKACPVAAGVEVTPATVKVAPRVGVDMPAYGSVYGPSPNTVSARRSLATTGICTN